MNGWMLNIIAKIIVKLFNWNKKRYY